MLLPARAEVIGGTRLMAGSRIGLISTPSRSFITCRILQIQRRRGCAVEKDSQKTFVPVGPSRKEHGHSCPYPKTHCAPQDPDHLQLEEQGWLATGDYRFAASYLAERVRQGNLATGDAALERAVRQFPQTSEILAIANGVSKEPSAELLIQGIKAEYRRFSGNATPLIERPSARRLRAYFHLLEKLAR